MRSSLVRLSLVLSLIGAPEAFSPGIAQAAYVSFGYDFDTNGSCNYMSINYGSGVPNAWIDDSLGCSLSIYTSAGDFDMVGGTLSLVTGPLLDVTPRVGIDDSIYTYASGGLLKIEFELLLAPGKFFTGSFTAPVETYTIYSNGPQDAGATVGNIGAGLFDKESAKLFGINRQTTGGEAGFYLDSYGTDSEPIRNAPFFGAIDVAAVEAVPEPSLVALLGIAGAAAIKRRVTRRTESD
jgi:hypothetical protein